VESTMTALFDGHLDKRHSSSKERKGSVQLRQDELEP